MRPDDIDKLSGAAADTGSMSAPSYKRHRFPPEVIAHAVWLYYRFALSFRDIEEMLASRGVMVSYEAIRLWCGKFGPEYARKLRSHRQQVGGCWHVDEVFIRINGTIHYLWRAVDQNGQIVDILLQTRRDRAAAERFFRHLLKRTDTVPHTVITDRLRSYSAALPHVLPKVRHKRGHWLNNRAENSHQPTRERERRMRRFKSSQQAQRFLSIHSIVSLISDLAAIGSTPGDTGQYAGNDSAFGTPQCKPVRSRLPSCRQSDLVRPALILIPNSHPAVNLSMPLAAPLISP